MNLKDCNKLVRKYIQEHGSNDVGYISSIELLDSFTTEYNTKFFGKIYHGFDVTFSQLQNMFGN